MLSVELLTIYFTISFFIGVMFVCEVTINNFNYKEMKLWHLIISVIFFIGTILGIFVGYMIVKINNIFIKTNIYKTLNQKPFRR